jgi:hypothetical protein
MNVALSALVLVAFSGLASGAPPSAEWAITREGDATLPAEPGDRDIVSLLVEAHWLQHNPKKETSKWSTMHFVFGADHLVSVMRNDGSMPVMLRWKLVRAGTRPVISIAGTRYTLATCVRSDATLTLCLFGTLIS